MAQRVAAQLRAFKVGINCVRSRGDREEPFGGVGQSWKGGFAGGCYLVLSVTRGKSDGKMYGNFPDYTLLPDEVSLRARSENVAARL